MPHQRYIYDVLGEIDPETGNLAYRRGGLRFSRQQGKTASLQTIMSHRLMAWKRQNVIYTAQDRNFARKRWEEEFVEAWKSIRLFERGFEHRFANGSERSLWRATRSSLSIQANTEKAGHGPPLDMGIMDEYFAQVDERLEQAFSPAMLTRANAQLLWASAAGTEKSVPLNKATQNGRFNTELALRRQASGRSPGTTMFYVDWSQDYDGVDIADPAVWAAALPAMCPKWPCRCDPNGVWHHTCSIATIASEFELMGGGREFARAYLGITATSQPLPDKQVPRAEFEASLDESAKMGRGFTIGIEVSRTRDRAWLIAYGPPESDATGKMMVEIVDTRPGVAWIPEACRAFKQRWNIAAFAINPRGPANALIDDLSAVGIAEPEDRDSPGVGDLYIPRTSDISAATGQIIDGIRAGRYVQRGQPPLTAAMNGARTKPSGDGAIVWDVVKSLTDVSPLTGWSVALAAWNTRGHILNATTYDATLQVW
jgi:phage terminase large subunit-like protein